MTIPPTIFNSTDTNKFNPTLQYIYESGVGFRAVEPSDLGGGTVNITGDLVFNTEQIEGQLSGVQNTLNSGIYNVPSGRVYALTNLPSGTPTGQLSEFAIASGGHGLVTVIPNLERSSDFVTACPLTSVNVTGSGLSTGVGQIFSAGSRSLAMVQNLSTNPLYVSLSTICNSGSFNFILKGGTAADDGSAAIWTSDSWIGNVAVSGSSPRYTYFSY